MMDGMRTRRCEYGPCGAHLSARHAHNARFCSGRCRVASHRAGRRVPSELTRRPRWVRHSARKVPLTTAGRPASSTDPATWSTHRAAASSAAGAGLGFVLDGDGIVCLDLDHCVDAEGEVASWAQRVIDSAGPTWIELSRSRRGLHIWGLGSLPHGRRISLDGGGTVEMYADGRFISVTGETFGDTPSRLGDLQHVIDSLL